MAEALYRKYRPQIFEDVVGQEHIERTLKNAIDQDKVSHAYLFTGPRGTGKTTTARLLAKALLCEEGPTSEPDGTCEDCVMIAASEHPDVYELDAASRTGVENVREEIIGRVQFAATRGRYKIYIIDEVHMLSTAAFNALLKTLEEPPEHVVFILATTDPQKVPETIQSRCQRFDFRRISSEAIVSRLGAICVAEGVEFEGDALELIAHRAEGGMRDALTSLDQLITFGEGKVTLEVAERMLGSLDTSDLAEIVRFIGQRDTASCFRWTAAFMETGADLAQFTRDLAEHVRNMYVMSLAGADVALDVSETTRRELTDELSMFGSDRLAHLLGVLGDLSAELKTSSNQRLSFEIALTRMVRPESDLTLEALADRVEKLEARPSAAPATSSRESRGPYDGVSQEDVLADDRANGMDSAAGTASDVQRNASVVTGDADNRRDAFDRVAESEEQPQESAAESRLQADAGASERAASGSASTGQGASAHVLDSMANAAALQRMWQMALDDLRQTKAPYAVLFLNAKVRFDESSRMLVVEFPAENDFAFKAAQKSDVQDELGAALQRACGEPVTFSLMKTSAAQTSTSQVASDVQDFKIADSSSEAVEHPSDSSRAAESCPDPKPGLDPGSEPEPVFDSEPDPGIDPGSDPDPDSYSDPYFDAISAPASDAASDAAADAISDAPSESSSASDSASGSEHPTEDGSEPEPESSSDNGEPSVDELDEMLSLGFGEGVAFSEVHE